MLSGFGPLLGLAVEASNNRAEELQREYHQARSRAARIGSVVFWLYLVGSLLALSGTVLGKLVPAQAAPDRATSAAPSAR